MESINVEDLCVLLENVTSEEGEACNVKKQAHEHVLEKLLELTEQVSAGKKGSLSLATRARLLSVVAGHIGTHYWTNNSSRTLTNKLLSILCQWHGCKDVQVLLIQESSLVRAVLTHLQTCLHSDNWRQRPVQKQSLVWCIKHLKRVPEVRKPNVTLLASEMLRTVKLISDHLHDMAVDTKHPNVSPLLSYFLPPLLWMLDDYSDYNRSLALSLISHVIQHMDSSELRWQGRAELFYQAMRPLLYVSSVQVIYSLHSCLLLLLPVLDFSPSTPPGPAWVTKADEVFSILITSLAKESKLSLQRAYSAQVKNYIHYLGIYCTTHIRDVLPLLLSLLLYRDPDQETLRRHALEGIAILISCCWPRMAAHQVSIIRALAQLMEESSECEELMDLVVKCLSRLLAAVPQLKDRSEHLLSCCEKHQHSAFKQCLQLAMASP